MSDARSDGASAAAVLSGRVTEAGSDEPFPAWVRIIAADGSVVDDWDVHETLRGFPCAGEFRVSVPAGRVRVAVHRLCSHEWAVDDFEAEPGQRHERRYELSPWVDPKSMGYFCGDSHNHLNHPTSPDRVVLYCRALGIDYLNVCQGWMTPNDSEAGVSGADIEQRLRAHSTDDFHMHFGAERPKTRYGHVWWWLLPPFQDPFGEYLGFHDSRYFAVAGKSPEPLASLREALPFTNEPPFVTWKRYRDGGAACALAHPTSWWTDAADADTVCTNISVEMPLALLAGGRVDAIVVMGYDPDHVFYQNTWFHILNAGYDLPAVAETDGAMKGWHHIGQILGYVPTPDGQYSPEGVVDGVRKGRCVMSSGPFVLLTADGGAVHTGDAVAADGSEHTLDIRAWADPDPDEFLSFVVVYRNGQVFRKIDLRAGRPRRFETRIPVAEDGGRAWYVVKVYGSTYPEQDVFFDVFKYAELCEREPHTEYVDIRQVALTNAIFFLAAGWEPPRPVVCRTTLRIVAEDGSPVAGAVVRAIDCDDETARLATDADGVALGEFPPTCRFDISAEGFAPQTKWLFLDYDPVNEHLEHCMAGRWRKDTPSELRPGQVPWREFRLRELRAALENVHWTIVLPPAGRPGQTGRPR